MNRVIRKILSVDIQNIRQDTERCFIWVNKELKVIEMDATCFMDMALDRSLVLGGLCVCVRQFNRRQAAAFSRRLAHALSSFLFPL